MRILAIIEDIAGSCPWLTRSTLGEFCAPACGRLWPDSEESANLEQVRLLCVVKHAPVGTPPKPAPGLPASRSVRQRYPRACVSFRRCSRRDLPAASFLRMDQGGRDYGQRVAPSGNVFERREASRVSAETRVSSRLIRIK